jgi:hypothetical protein
MRTSLEKLAAIKINYRPLKFNCSNCNQPIIVKYLQKGDEAQCPACGWLNKVPIDAIETDEQPDYTRIKQFMAGGGQNERQSKKLLSAKRASGSALAASLFISILSMIDKNPNGFKHFILAFVISYLFEYLWPSKNIKRKLNREIARTTCFCHVCSRTINRGEQCYFEKTWRSYLSKIRQYFCLKCYEEIFMNPEPPTNQIKQPSHKFKLFPGN